MHYANALQPIWILMMNWWWVNGTYYDSFKMKPSKAKTEAPSTQNLKTKHPNLENEAPKTQDHCRLNNYNFMSRTMQSEWGGGSGFVCTSIGPQNPFQGFIKACKLFNWTFLDRISCINLITSLTILDISYLNVQIFSTHTCLCRLQNCPWC